MPIASEVLELKKLIQKTLMIDKNKKRHQNFLMPFLFIIRNDYLFKITLREVDF